MESEMTKEVGSAKTIAEPVVVSEKSLVKYQALCDALAQAMSVDEVKDIRNKAEALRAIARQANDRTLEIDAAELRIKAERRLGQMLGDQKRTVGLASGGGDKRSDQRVKQRPGDLPSLAEVGIDKYLADRARKWAAMSEEEYAKHLGIWRAEAARSHARITIGVFRTLRNEQQANDLEKTLRERDPRRDITPLYDLEEDSEDDNIPIMPSARELDRQYYQQLLETNPSAPADYQPRKFNSVAKIVSEAIVRLGLIREFVGEPGDRRMLMQTVDNMDDRLKRLMDAIRKSTVPKNS